MTDILLTALAILGLGVFTIMAMYVVDLLLKVFK